VDVLRSNVLYTQLPGSNPLAMRECGLTVSSFSGTVMPDPGKVFFYMVTGVSGGIEGTLGSDSESVLRLNANPCP